MSAPSLVGRAVQILHENPTISRSELGERLSVTRSTVGTLASELVERGFATQSGGIGGQVGRPSLHIHAVPESVTSVAVHVQRDRISSIRYGLGGVVLERSDEARRTAHAAEAIAAELADAAQRVHANGLHQNCVVSVSIPGVLYNGTIFHAPELHWRDVALGDVLRATLFQRTGIDAPVVWSNDANAGALAESLRGAARDVPSVLYLASGTGIGAGLIRRGDVVEGAHGFAGEVGHMVLEPNGPLCSCGSTGCWQALIGFDAIRSAAQWPRATAEELLHSSRIGDPTVRTVLSSTAQWFAIGLINVVLTVDPHTVVVGGHLGTLLPEIGPEFHRRWAGAIVGQRTPPRLVAAGVADAELIGAGERGIRVAIGQV